MSNYFDISGMLRRAIDDLDDVHAMMVGQDKMFGISFWDENGLRPVASIRNQLADFLARPDSLLEPSEESRIRSLLTEMSNVTATWVWEDRQILGALGSAHDLLTSLRDGTDIVVRHDLVVPEAPRIVFPTEETLKELIRQLGPDPRAWHALGSRKFEELLAEIWSGLGWQTILTPPSRDGGFDIRAVKNHDGLCLCYLIEAKAYDPAKPIGIDVVRRLYGVVERERVTHGIVATTSRFTKGAVEECHALKYRLSLADFNQVFRWSQQYLNLAENKNT